MNKIRTINPEDVLKNTESTHFQIVLAKVDGYEIWTGNGSANMEFEGSGFGSGRLIEKMNLAKEYYAASSFFKSDTGRPIEGSLEVIALPVFIE